MNQIEKEIVINKRKAEQLNFPQERVIHMFDYLSEVNLMLSNQMKTFGLTMDRVERLDYSPDYEVFVDKLTGMKILETRKNFELFKVTAVYVYSDLQSYSEHEKETFTSSGTSSQTMG